MQILNSLKGKLCRVNLSINTTTECIYKIGHLGVSELPGLHRRELKWKVKLILKVKVNPGTVF
jgi:hypothetical protein